MAIGTLFTLFVVPVFYSLIAARHPQRTAGLEEEPAGEATSDPMQVVA
jgi:multidrug efflux pump